MPLGPCTAGAGQAGVPGAVQHATAAAGVGGGHGRCWAFAGSFLAIPGLVPGLFKPISTYDWLSPPSQFLFCLDTMPSHRQQSLPPPDLRIPKQPFEPFITLTTGAHYNFICTCILLLGWLRSLTA